MKLFGISLALCLLITPLLLGDVIGTGYMMSDVGLRSQPEVADSFIFNLTKWDTVQIVEDRDDWLLVRRDGKEGWIENFSLRVIEITDTLDEGIYSDRKEIRINTTGYLTPKTRIISQSESPITITYFLSEYREGFYYKSFSEDEGIYHSLHFKNISDKLVVAISFGLVSFNVWNQLLDVTYGLTLEEINRGAISSGKWVATAYSDFSFLTGVAYVNKVRFADGTIWSADLEEVLYELLKIQEDFDIMELEDKKG